MNHPVLAQTALGAACLCLLAPARAQTAPPADAGVSFDLAPVVVSAPAVGTLGTRSLLTSVDSLAGAAVQDANVGANWELFTRLPGVALTNFNQGTTSGKPSFRGFNGEGEVNAVKLLIDGVPSNSNDGNMPYLDLVTPLGLAGITTVRGTNDARYGLHNIAGNIELNTRQGGDATEGRLGIGPWGKADAQLAIDRESGGLTQNYAIGLRRADNWRDHAKAERASVSGQWGVTPEGQDLRIGLALRLHHADADEPGYLTAAQAYGPNPRQTNPWNATDTGQRLVGQGSLSIEGGQRSTLAWRALVYLNRFEDERWVTFSGNVSQQERDTYETHRGARALVSWRPQVAGLTDFALEGGADTERQRNTSMRFLTTARDRDSQTRDQSWSFDIHGVFVQAVIRPLPSLKLVPGYRIDRVGGHLDNRLTDTRFEVNDYGTIKQPKLSAVWTATDALTAYANWGRSFQVGVGAAAFKVPPRVADLDASINDGVELGLKFRHGEAIEGRVALWRQTATNEVYRELNNPSGDSVNIGATRRRGIDLQVRGRPAATIEAFATLGLQEAIITTPNPSAPETAGKEVDHAPKRLYNAGLDWQATPALKLSSWLQGQSSYWLERSNAATGRYGSFTTLNLGASWAMTPALQLDAQLLNVTDGRREYVWWDGTQTLHSPGEPRSLNVALRASF